MNRKECRLTRQEIDQSELNGRLSNQALAHVAGEITKFIEAEAGNGRLKNERGLLKQALEDTQGMLGSLVGYLTASQEDPQSINKVGSALTGASEANTRPQARRVVWVRFIGLPPIAIVIAGADCVA